MSLPESAPQSAPARRRWEGIVADRDASVTARAARLMLGALSGLHWLGLKANLSLYTTGLKHRTQPALPVVSVGNLTLGGTGKTTAVQFLARCLQDAGIRPAVVLRGYRASRMRAPVILISDEDTVPPDVAEVGDEACLLAQALPAVPLGVGKRREAVIAELAARTRAQVVLLDDGFQYFRMQKLADIVLIDATVDIGGQRLFPAGYLREPLSHLQRADQIWITHSDQVAESELAKLRATLAPVTGNSPLVETKHQISALTTLAGEPLSPEEIGGTRLLAVSAIGNARSFEKSLANLGAEVIPLRYDDHHYYSAGDLAHIDAAAREHQADFITITRKDAVKWLAGRTTVPVVVVDCALQIARGQQAVAALVAQIEQAVGGNE